MALLTIGFSKHERREKKITRTAEAVKVKVGVAARDGGRDGPMGTGSKLRRTPLGPRETVAANRLA